MRAGEDVAPIWNDPSRPTSDFDWINHRLSAVEMKHGHFDPENPRTVLNPIAKAAYRAAKHPWHPTAKEHFLLDFADAELTDEIREVLAQYNVGRRKYRITELWAMHSDGIIERIALAQ